MIFLMNQILFVLAISVYSLQIVFVHFKITQCGIILLAVKCVVLGCGTEVGNIVSIAFWGYYSCFLMTRAE